MRIDEGLLQVWPEFALDIKSGLDFNPGEFYHLSGANGSGKSSFITRILIPRLLAGPTAYVLYLEQQMRYQLWSVKSYASMIQPRREIKTEADAVTYLLGNLESALARESRPCYVILDESHHTREVRERLKQGFGDVCLIYTSHERVPDTARVISFTSINPSLSEVNANLD
jgi:ATPase subunit of ABC transporter with duplicated ATPase domains